VPEIGSVRLRSHPCSDFVFVNEHEPPFDFDFGDPRRAQAEALSRAEDQVLDHDSAEEWPLNVTLNKVKGLKSWKTRDSSLCSE